METQTLQSKELRWHKTFLQICEIISGHSHCERNKVGCCLVKDKRIISFGYNGMPSGFDNECEQGGKTKVEVLHAESNCLMKCASSTESSGGATLYSTTSPCIECAKLIIQAGVRSVYFKNVYRNVDGLDLLYKANIYYAQI